MYNKRCAGCASHTTALVEEVVLNAKFIIRRPLAASMNLSAVSSGGQPDNSPGIHQFLDEFYDIISRIPAELVQRIWTVIINNGCANTKPDGTLEENRRLVMATELPRLNIEEPQLAGE